VPVRVDLTLKGDYNGDGHINAEDVEWLRLSSREPVATPVDDRDVNGDRVIDERDVTALKALCTEACGPLDTTPPSVVCSLSDGAWHASNVTVTCSSQDTGSGLANTVDANFVLVTSVQDGEELASANTTSRQVCDLSGNCAIAGPIAGNKIDRKK